VIVIGSSRPPSRPNFVGFPSPNKTLANTHKLQWHQLYNLKDIHHRSAMPKRTVSLEDGWSLVTRAPPKKPHGRTPNSGKSSAKTNSKQSTPEDNNSKRASITDTNKHHGKSLGNEEKEEDRADAEQEADEDQVEELTSKVAHYLDRWREHSERAKLHAAIRERFGSSSGSRRDPGEETSLNGAERATCPDKTIHKAIMLGLGTFSDKSVWIIRCLWQLALFLDLVDTLTSLGLEPENPEIPKYASDPHFTPTDVALLKRLNITVIHPRGPSESMKDWQDADKDTVKPYLTPSTFIFTPYLPWKTLLTSVFRASHPFPVLYVGTSVPQSLETMERELGPAGVEEAKKPGKVACSGEGKNLVRWRNAQRFLGAMETVLTLDGGIEAIYGLEVCLRKGTECE
jgi:SRR1